MHVYAVYVSDQCKCLQLLTRRVELELVVALVRSSVHLEESYSLSLWLLSIIVHNPRATSDLSGAVNIALASGRISTSDMGWIISHAFGL